jgi:hypothetical protein
MVTQTELRVGKTPRTVKRGAKCQNKNEVGVHWLRISILRRHLPKLLSYLECYFGKSSKDGRGLWSYDTRYFWPNGASLNFDSDPARSEMWHNGKCTLEIPGQALDVITKTDLHLFLLSLNQFNPTCTRIDVFFDDFRRTINIGGLHGIIKNHDYSGFRKGQVKQGFDSGRLIHDEVDFGKRGENGSGKYLRIYDKVLESKGEKNCIRLEIEFTRKRAQIVFDKLSSVVSNEAFATLCGALVAGSIKFIQRNGDKHISRLTVYDFWQDILDLLGTVTIRVPVKKTDIQGKYDFIFKQVSPTLALLRDIFIDDIDFFCWLDDVIGEGKLRMNQGQINLANENKRDIRYDVDRVVNRFNRVNQIFEGT